MPDVTDLLRALTTRGVKTPAIQPVKAATGAVRAVVPKANIISSDALQRAYESVAASQQTGPTGPLGMALKSLALFDKPRAAVMSTMKELTDLAAGKGASFGDWKRQIDQHYGFGEFQQEYLPWIEDVAVPGWAARRCCAI